MAKDRRQACSHYHKSTAELPREGRPVPFSLACTTSPDSCRQRKWAGVGTPFLPPCGCSVQTWLMRASGHAEKRKEGNSRLWALPKTPRNCVYSTLSLRLGRCLLVFTPLTLSTPSPTQPTNWPCPPSPLHSTQTQTRYVRKLSSVPGWTDEA